MSFPTTLAETHRLWQTQGGLLIVRRDWIEALPVDDMLAGAELSSWRPGRAGGDRARFLYAR